MKFQNKPIKSILLSMVMLLIFHLYIPKSPATTVAMTPKQVLAHFEAKMSALQAYTVESTERNITIGPQGMEESSSQGKTFVKGKKRYCEMSVTQDKRINGKRPPKSPKSLKDISPTIKDRIIQVSDGTISWFYDTSKGEVKKTDLSKMPVAVQEKIRSSQDAVHLDLPEGLEFTLDEKTQTVGSEKRKYYVLTSRNRVTHGSRKYEKMILWFDAKDYLPFKVELKEKIIVRIPKAKNLEIQNHLYREFHNWECNGEIPDNLFAFTVPEGVKVIDVTDKTKDLYKRIQK